MGSSGKRGVTSSWWTIAPLTGLRYQVKQMLGVRNDSSSQGFSWSAVLPALRHVPLSHVRCYLKEKCSFQSFVAAEKTLKNINPVDRNQKANQQIPTWMIIIILFNIIFKPISWLVKSLALAFLNQPRTQDSFMHVSSLGCHAHRNRSSGNYCSANSYF